MRLTGAGRQGGIAAHDAARDVGHRVPLPGRGDVDAERGRTEWLGVDVEVLRAALPDEPITARSSSIWAIACSRPTIAGRSRLRTAHCRSCAPRRSVSGRIPNPRRSRYWRAPLPDPRRQRHPSRAAVSRGVRPRDARRHRPVHLLQDAPDRPRARRPADDSRRRGATLFDLPRAPRAAGHASTGSLSAGVRLDHPCAP